MKLGIYLPDIRPGDGGAFTFVETVVPALLGRTARDSAVVFHYGPSSVVPRLGDDRLEFHSLAVSTAGRLARKTWYGGLASRLRGPLALAARAFERTLPYPAASPLDHAVRARGVDLVWFPTPLFELVEVPSIVTIWDLEHRAQPYFPELVARGTWYVRERQLEEALRRATYVVTGTEVGRDEIVQFYNVHRERVRILPHPTPSFALAAAETEIKPLGVSVGRPYVVYPAQFWSHKNHVGLLDGLAELARRGTIVHAALVGSDKGNQAHVRARAAELGLADQVHFLGFIERDELVALYRHAAALAYTSLCGPENLPPLEAMALGCPVIATDIPGAREQLGDAAVLVDTLDPGALADAITRVMTTPALRAQLVERGRARAAKYTQREFARDLHALVEDFRRRRELWGVAR
jgi:glycosyltransferase involved in cell wall biosynthesis